MTLTASTETKSAEGRRSEHHEKIGASLHPLAPKSAIGNQARLRMRARYAPALQAKLQINQPGDAFEQEADSLADQVMRMAAPLAVPPPPNDSSRNLQRKCSCGGEGGECADCAEKKEEAGLQRFAARLGLGASPRGGFAPPIVHQVLSSPGHPLDRATRDFMEARFGQDFSRVRVHMDSRAAESARSVSALAYTVGSNIVFNRGFYSPGTESGRHLLAHELTHVLQQGSGGLSVQRDAAKFDVDGAAAEVEGSVCVPGQEGASSRQALIKLDGIAEIQNLLDVTAKLYDNYEAVMQQHPQPCRAFPFLDSDLRTGQEKAGLAADRLQRLIGAFEAAKVHKQRNPRFKDDPEATKPTLSQARERSKSGQPARVGDWGEDPAGNTWVMHSEGIRTYWTSSVKRESGKRSSQWLGKNVGNFGGNRAVAHRMISSFKWGKGYDFAIYNDEKDSEADLRENMGKVGTVGTYIDKNHLGPGDDRPTYYKNLQDAVKGVDSNLTFDPGDSTQKWVVDNAMWGKLFEAFKTAEGWKKGETIDASNVKTKSSKPEDAKLTQYYSDLLGVAAAPASKPSPEETSPKPEAGK